MKTFAFCLIFASIACLGGPQTASAQGGGIIDWIHRLSGPTMAGPALSYSTEISEGAVRLRLTGAYRFPVAGKDKVADGHTLRMASLQPGIEVPIGGGPFELNAGVALHRLGGDGHDAAYHWSIPVYAQVRVPINTFFVRVGVGGHFFPSFSEEVGQWVDVETEESEFPLAIIVGVDWVWD